MVHRLIKYKICNDNLWFILCYKVGGCSLKSWNHHDSSGVEKRALRALSAFRQTDRQIKWCSVRPAGGYWSRQAELKVTFSEGKPQNNCQRCCVMRNPKQEEALCGCKLGLAPKAVLSGAVHFQGILTWLYYSWTSFLLQYHEDLGFQMYTQSHPHLLVGACGVSSVFFSENTYLLFNTLSDFVRIFTFEYTSSWSIPSEYFLGKHSARSPLHPGESGSGPLMCR